MSTGTINLATGKTYQINGTDVLSGTTLGSGVINSSLTSVGALTTGSIANGFGTIATTNTITGTTLNGTTGINTGAGAGTQRIDSSGNLANIGTITAAGLISANGGLTVANGQNFTLSSFATNNNSVLYTGAAGVVNAATTPTTGQCLMSNANTPAWATCPGSSTTNYWQLNNGNISPYNNSLDVLVGGTSTSSAKFGVLNVNSGTPTASLSAGASGGTYITANGTLQTTGNQALTIGGNTTGDITLSPLNGNGTVTSTGNLNLASGKTYKINGVDVLSSTTLGSGVTASSLTSVGTLTSGVWNATVIGAQYGGTGLNTSASTGVPTISSGTWSVSSALSAALGGTGDNTAATTGVPYIAGGDWQYEAQLATSRGGTGLNTSSAANGQLLIGNGSGLSLANLTAGTGISITNGSGSITIAQTGGGSSKWTQNDAAGTLNPNNTTLDVLFGGTATSSAKFGVLNMAGGTPTASLSAGAAGGSYLTATGLLQTTANQTLTIGGNTTGNIILSPQNGAGTVMSTGTINLASGKTYQINGTDVLSGTTLGSGVVNSSLTSVGVLASGSIANGFGTIATTNTITGTTLNGTTGINSGAGAGTQRIDSSGNLVNIGTITAAGLISANGGLTVANGQNTTLSSFTSNNNSVLYTNGSGVINTSTTATPGQCLMSNANTPAWAACPGASATNYWQLNNGAVSPFSNTLDVLVGATATASAKFGVLNVNSGTPTASLSAGAAGGTYVTANGTLQTTANQTLTIGGNTTGNIILSPQNGSGTVMSTGSINLASGKTYQINGTDVLSGTTLGSGVVNSSLTSVGALASGSIANGFGTIATTNTITGTTLNGTTGINSGAGAGTQRIDASGNLVNIGTIDSTYLDTTTNAVNLAASTVLQFNGTTVIDATRNLNNIAGLSTNLNPTVANTYSIGTSTGNQLSSVYSNTLYQNGNQVCDTSGNCAGGAGGSKWQKNGSVLAPLVSTDLVVLGGNTSTAFQFEVNGKQSGKALASLNETGDQNILTASASGTNVFNINRNGNVQFAGNTSVLNTLTSLATSGRTYTFPDSTGTVCLVEAGNCAGSGGGLTGSGTAGQISFFNGTNTLTSETSGFAWDATNNRFGIGNDTPQGKFDLAGANTGKALSIFNETGDQNIIAASASGTTVFTLDRSGNLSVEGQLSDLTGTALTVNDNLNLVSGNVYQINGTNVLSNNTLGSGVTASSLTSVGTLTTGVWNATVIGAQYGGTGLNTSASTGVPTISSGTWSVSAALAAALGGTGDDTSATTGVPYIAAGNWQYESQLATSRGGTGLNTSSAANGQLLIGNGSGLSLANLTAGTGISITNGSGSITIAQTGGGSSKWTQNDATGTLTPNNNSLDVLFGGSATSSAKFGVLNMAGGTPTASLSAGAAGGSYLTANGTLQTTANQTLTIGGNTTGNIILSPQNGSGTVMSTGSINLASGKTYQINGTDVLSGTTLGSGVVNSSLTSVGALASGSIANGFGTIATTNTITGTTLNGTTGINTGAGAGTQRIDASGNLANIGTITAGGLISANAGLTVANGQNLTLSSFTTNNNSVLYTGASGVVNTATTATPGQCLMSNANTPAWASCPGASATNYWQLNNGSISPFSNTLDVLVGATATSSAKFGVLNVNSGTPTASLSAGAAGGTYIAANGTLQTTANQALTIGGNTTGDITLSPLNGNGTVNSTGNLNLASGKTYKINGIDVLSSTTLGANVVNSSLTSVGTITSGTWNATAIGAQYGGTGDDTSGTTGVPYITAGNWQYESQLNPARGGTGVNGSTAANGQLLIGNGSGFSLANITAGTGINISNGSGTITISQTGSGSSKWTQNDVTGTLNPNNTTLDTLFGGTATASAKFGILNMAGGTPTASLSAGAAGGTYLAANGLLQTTANQTLTIGGNTTGNIILSPQNGAGTVMSTGTMNLASGKTYQINGTDVLSGTTLGTGVVNSSLTSVGALTSGSIASGFGTIATANTITGTTINGTTGINSGAGAGTQRIDSSGNLANIGTITAAGLISANGGLTVANGQNTTLSSFTTNNNSVLYTGASGVVNAATTVTSGQCLMSNANTPAWAACPGASATNYWQLNNGSISPFSNTLDVLVGATATSSAKFGVLNVNSGTPTASLSAGAAGGTYISANGTLQTTANQALTIGGNTTGDITLSPLNGNGTVNSTGNLNLASGKTYKINGVDVLSNTTLGANVVNSSLTSVGTITSGTWNGTAIAPQYGGTGDDTSGTTGVPYITAGNWQYESQLNAARGGTGVNGSTAANGQLLIGNGSGFSLANITAGAGISITNGSGAITIAQTGSGSSKWTEGAGYLTPNNNSLDILVGGTATSSAKFGVLNINSGTPTASLSAGAAGGSYLTASGLLQTTANQTLTIGGNTTGNIILSPQNGSGTVMSTGTINLATGKTYQINGTDVLSGTTLGSGVVNSSLTSVGALASGSIASGFGTITTANTITGTTLNGTTGINTGVGAGTQRIDSAGNLANIGTITAAGLISANGGLTVANGQNTTLSSFTTNNNSVLYTGASGVVNAATTVTTGQCLMSNANTPAWASCPGASATNYWQLNNGAISPFSNTLDVLVGGTATTSAKFGILNVNSGTPTASLSAGAAGGLYLDATGKLATTAKQTLTIGDSTTTGNVIINPSGNIGIGTAAPSGFLDVFQGTNTSRFSRSTTQYLQLSTDTNYNGFYSVSTSGVAKDLVLATDTNSNGIAFRTNSSGLNNTRMYITNGGSIGVGTITPLATLDVRGNSGTTPVSSISGQTAFASMVVDNSGSGDIFTASSSGLSRFVIKQDGKVGIGITNPNTPLHVMNTSDGATTSVITLGNGGSSANTGASINFNLSPTNTNTNAQITAIRTNNPANLGTLLSFRTHDGTSLLERMRLSETGQLSVGSTALNPLATLDVRGVSGTRPTASISGQTAFAGMVVDNSGTGDIFSASSSGLNRFVIAQNGNVGIGKALPTSTLDVAGTVAASGLISANGGLTVANGQNTTLSSFTSNNNSVLYTNGSGVVNAATTVTTGQCLMSNANTPAWGTCPGASASNYWQLNNGAISPFSNSLDLLVGGTSTSSAKFGILNVNSGTPTASLSAGANGGTYLTADGTLSTTTAQTLTIGGPTTGDIVLNAGSNVLQLADNNLQLTGSAPVLGATTTNAAVQLNANGNGTLTLNNGTTGNIQFFSSSNTLSSAGNLTLAGTSHTFGNGSATTLQTSGNANLTLSAAGSGNLVLASDANTGVYVGTSANTPAPLSVSGGIGNNAAFIVNNTNSGNLIAASASGTTKFIVDNSGNMATTGVIQTNSLTPTTYNRLGTGVTGHGLSTADDLFITGKLEVDGSLFIDGNLIPGGTVGTVGWFQRNSNALSPTNITDDLLLGSTATASAKFGFLNNAGGTPVASISANTVNNATYLTGDGTLGTTNRASLTLGNSATYNTTGNVLINSNGQGKLGIGTTNPMTNLHLVASGATVPTLSASNIAVFQRSSANNTSAGISVLSGNASTTNFMYFSDTDAEDAGGLQYNHVTDALSFRAGGANQLVIDGSGSRNHFFTNNGNHTLNIQTVASNIAGRQLTIRGGDAGAGASDVAGGILQLQGGTGAGTNGAGGVLRLMGGVPAGAGAYGAITLAHDGTNGRGLVGVGTASPLATLDVRANSGTIAVASISGRTSFAALTVDNATGDLFTASSSGLNRFVIKNNGNVGIGTTSPNEGGYSGTTLTLKDPTGNTPVIETVRNTSSADTILFTYRGNNSNSAVAGFDFRTDLLDGTQGTIAFQTRSASGLAERMRINGAGSVGIGTTNPLATLDLRGNLGTIPMGSISGQTSVAGLVVDNNGVGDLFTASKSGASKFTVLNNGNIQMNNYNGNNAVLYGTSGTGVVASATTNTTGLCLMSNANTPAWATCPGGGASTNYWQMTNGTVSPFSNTLDLLVGGVATSSAKFGILNVNSGTPTASLSAGATGGTYLTAAGILQTTANQTLTLGGNTTGNIILQPLNGTGKVGINTVNPDTTLSLIKDSTGLGTGTIGNYGFNVGQAGGGLALGDFGTFKALQSFGNTPLIINPAASNVGIGNVTSPLAMLDVRGRSGTIPVASFSGQTASAAMIVDNNGLGDLFTASKSGATKFIIQNSGNVGIGTANPISNKLLTISDLANPTVGAAANGLAVVTSGGGGIYMKDNGTGCEGKFESFAGTIGMGSNGGCELGLHVNGGEKVRLDQNGNFGINTTTPLATLDVRGTSGTTPVASVAGQTSFAAMVVNNRGTGDIFTASSAGKTRFTIKQNGVVLIGDNTNGLQFDYLNGGPNYFGTARPSKQIVLSPEYAGAVITASGSGTTNGLMTSDASTSANLNLGGTTNNFLTYYEWSSSQTSLQDYTVAVRVKLPADFSSWAPGGSALQLAYDTELGGNGSNKMDFKIIPEGQASNASTPSVYYQNQNSAAKTWSTINVSANDLNDAPTWNTASASAIIYMKMYSRDNNHVQIGDIILNYLSKF